MALNSTLVGTHSLALAVVNESRSKPVGNDHLDLSEIFTPMQCPNDKSISNERQSIDLTDD
jgi:hypothetical protein